MRFEPSLNAPTSLRLARGMKPVRGLEKWRGGIEVSHETVETAWTSERLRVCGKVRSCGDGPCVLAKAGDSLTVWVIPDEVVGGALVQSARILYGML